MMPTFVTVIQYEDNKDNGVIRNISKQLWYKHDFDRLIAIKWVSVKYHCKLIY